MSRHLATLSSGDDRAIWFDTDVAKAPVYLEIGRKRVFAGSVDWPGWTRSGRDEDTAIDALLAYAPRFAKVLRGTRLKFDPPSRASALTVVEQLSGNATTEFGAPDIPPSADTKPITTKDLERFQTILKATWQALDRAADAAAGKELTKGPRDFARRSSTRSNVSLATAFQKDLVAANGGRLDTSFDGRRGTSSTMRGRSRTARPDSLPRDGRPAAAAAPDPDPRSEFRLPPGDCGVPGRRRWSRHLLQRGSREAARYRVRRGPRD